LFYIVYKLNDFQIYSLKFKVASMSILIGGVFPKKGLPFQAAPQPKFK
jgi:hypothetical protein